MLGFDISLKKQTLEILKRWDDKKTINFERDFMIPFPLPFSGCFLLQETSVRRRGEGEGEARNTV